MAAMRGVWRCLVLLGLALVSVGAADRDLPLVEAAKADDRGAVRTLLKQGALPTAAMADGTTALHWVAYWDDVEGAELLLRSGANVNAANDLGATPLWIACENGGAAIVGRLLQAGANPNMALLSGETPLMLAARSGNTDVVRQLLDKGADANARESARGQTALMWAISERHPSIVGLLLAHRADVHARTNTWTQRVKTTPEQGTAYITDVLQGGYTPLLFAARMGDLASAKLLVAAGAPVNDAAPYGTSALVVAAHSGHTETAAFLLEKGADPNAAAAGYTALHVAIVRRDEKLVATLLAAGADSNTRVLSSTPTRRQSGDTYIDPAFVGSTPLWLAARYSAPGIMRLLAKHGADPGFVHHLDYLAQSQGYTTVPVKEGDTTILMAAAGLGGHILLADSEPPPDPAVQEPLVLEAVRVAVEFGLDVNSANADGDTALHAVTASRYDSVIKFLVDKGANSNAKNKRGETPFEAAQVRRRR